MAVALAAVVALLAGTPFARAASLALGIGLALVALGRWRTALRTVGLVIAAVGTFGLELAPGLGVLGLVGASFLVVAVAAVLTARGHDGGAAFVGAGVAGLVLGLELGLALRSPLVVLVVAVAAGIATAVLIGRRRRPHPARGVTARSAWVAGIAAIILVAVGAGAPIGRGAAVVEAELQGQQPAPQLPGRGWIYYSAAGGPQFLSSRVVVLPAHRTAGGGCTNGAAMSGTATAGSGPTGGREIAFNPLTCQVAIREGPVRP